MTLGIAEEKNCLVPNFLPNFGYDGNEELLYTQKETKIA